MEFFSLLTFFKMKKKDSCSISYSSGSQTGPGAHQWVMAKFLLGHDRTDQAMFKVKKVAT